MTKIIVLLAFMAIATATPKPSKLNFRNLYKEPLSPQKLVPRPRIIGGQEAEVNQIPYQVLFEFYKADSGWYCGGSLISNHYVLTAAHCTYEAQIAQVTLGALRAFEDEESQVKIVSRNITTHPKWDDEVVDNDIALVELPKGVAFSDAISPVKLPKRNSELDLTGETARVSGWGITDGYGQYLSEVLNYVDLNIISNEECERYFGHLHGGFVCTSGEENRGSCSGDSGGPLVINDVQVGIVAFNIMFCMYEYPSAYTRITNFLDWIEENSDVVIS